MPRPADTPVHLITDGYASLGCRFSGWKCRAQADGETLFFAAQFFTEYPSLCYVPNATLSRAVNDWADQLMGSSPCTWDF